MLKQAGFSFNHKSYYYLYHHALSAEKDKFTGHITAVKDAGFVFKCRIKEEINQQSGKIVNT